MTAVLAGVWMLGCGGPAAEPRDEVAPDPVEEGTVSAAGACATSPSNTNCNGQDAMAQGCNTDSYAVTEQPIYDYAGLQIGRITLRHSRTCQSIWARATTTASGYNVTSTVINQVGTERSATAASTGVNSPMTFLGTQGTGQARARLVSPSAFVYIGSTAMVWIQ